MTLDPDRSTLMRVDTVGFAFVIHGNDVFRRYLCLNIVHAPENIPASLTHGVNDPSDLGSDLFWISRKNLPVDLEDGGNITPKHNSLPRPVCIGSQHGCHTSHWWGVFLGTLRRRHSGRPETVQHAFGNSDDHGILPGRFPRPVVFHYPC